MKAKIKHLSEITNTESDDYEIVNGKRFRKLKNFERDRSNDPVPRFWAQSSTIIKPNGEILKRVTCSDGTITEWIEPKKTKIKCKFFFDFFKFLYYICKLKLRIVL